MRDQTSAQLAAYQTATERVHTDGRTELEEVRGAAAKAVSDAQEAAGAAIQKAIADRDRILVQRAADMRQQIDRAKADAQAQVTILQNQLDAAKAEAEQLVKAMRGELAHAPAVTRAETEKTNTEQAAELHHEATVARQRAQAALAAARARGQSAPQTENDPPAGREGPTDV